MIHVLLRVAVWVSVFAVGYLIFGPELFDSSDGKSPFTTETRLYLPPAKPQQLIEYEAAFAAGKLAPDAQADYRAMLKAYQAEFWQGRDLSVSEALAGVERGRRAHLTDLLADRGLSGQEAGIFMMVVDRDKPELLRDPR